MKKLFLIIIFFSVSFSFSVSQTSRGMKKIEMQNAKGETFTAYDNSWALIIGVNNYSNDKIPPLNYATEDARAIAKLLEEMDFPKENIKVLLNDEATLSNVKQEISAMGAKTGKNDRLLVYWAGHGETEALPRGG
ncbi:MAG: caspase family protein, partial [Ignavibacteriales bacterium]|nr:caspase family protein [Ignavibacteriales bacterium]